MSQYVANDGHVHFYTSMIWTHVLRGMIRGGHRLVTSLVPRFATSEGLHGQYSIPDMTRIVSNSCTDQQTDDGLNT